MEGQGQNIMPDDYHLGGINLGESEKKVMRKTETSTETGCT